MDLKPAGVQLQYRSRRLRRNRPVMVELPDVVLDLDAEDSPYVRPFDRREAARQTAKWRHDPMVPEVEQLAEQLRADILSDGLKMRHMLAARHHPLTISDHDVLSVALLGGNSTPSLPADGEAADDAARRFNALLQIRYKSMRANGIPQRILARDPNTIIHFMLHRQKLVSASQETASVTTGSDANTSATTFEESVQHGTNLGHLQRLCSNNLSSGHEDISLAAMDHIARTLEKFKDSKTKHLTRQALKFVNNFTMRRLSANAELSPSMSLVGLVMAANLRLLPAVMQYLHICLSQGFIGTPQDEPETLGVIGQGILETLEKGDGLARGTRPELFTLLTGRALAGSAVQPALFGSRVSSSADDPHTYHVYVQLLGQLGAWRLLWHSWKRGSSERMRNHENLYYAAFIRCAEVLSDAKNVAGLDCTTATGDLERDAELDFEAIDALDAHHASSTSPEEPYTSHIESTLVWDEISGVLESPEIHQAVARINHVINSGRAASPKK